MTFSTTRRSALTLFGAGMTAATLGVPGDAEAANVLEGIRRRGFIRIAIANEVPYGFMNADGQAHGIAPDVAKHVLGEIGIHRQQWVVTPFGSLIPGLKARRFDMVAASQNVLPARCTQVAFSVINSSYGEGLLVKAGNPLGIHGYDWFLKHRDKKFAIVAGADELRFAHAVGIHDSQIVNLSANADALSAVADGRVAAYAATGLTVARLARHSKAVEPAAPFTQPVVHGHSVRSYGAFSFRKDETSLLTAFDKALDAYKKTDAWAHTLMKYGLTKQDVEAARQMTTADRCKA
ncbi:MULTISPECIES: ectoine/hydroxyectoine ABC transporter substrate-binding protein EhuB [unclassified Acidiphilium]|uniref:ectoine/hydroxyectoine ABC transporter substrate-binding protein EhuB n=1 Tax=unclassified Acidiphilium TaxID=2617493 RepID=UPI000BDDC11B|nr:MULTISPECIES: ectoine/hydroxyectoine ABC transporter substrate-binding protein EhuB [unclassified Acidiphilium]OYV55491.1 MAG: ectoine/hydroxyectoine ABC transporter substrate-binding protein EhuB [Acidiphilium sp. 20-67-58]HQT61698.1 ectoine/hydroxyectoine ABC transporter substrate-binding protein EhuB [Acidiphilium sp.]